MRRISLSGAAPRMAAVPKKTRIRLPPRRRVMTASSKATWRRTLRCWEGSVTPVSSGLGQSTPPTLNPANIGSPHFSDQACWGPVTTLATGSASLDPACPLGPPGNVLGIQALTGRFDLPMVRMLGRTIVCGGRANRERPRGLEVFAEVPGNPTGRIDSIGADAQIQRLEDEHNHPVVAQGRKNDVVRVGAGLVAHGSFERRHGHREHGSLEGSAGVVANLHPGHVSDGERSEEHTSELQSLRHLVCRLLL